MSSRLYRKIIRSTEREKKSDFCDDTADAEVDSAGINNSNLKKFNAFDLVPQRTKFSHFLLQNTVNCSFWMRTPMINSPLSQTQNAAIVRTAILL